MVYNKLIRDNVPNICHDKGIETNTRILDDEEYVLELKRKLVEESKEVLCSDSTGFLEELADVMKFFHIY